MLLPDPEPSTPILIRLASAFMAPIIHAPASGFKVCCVIQLQNRGAGMPDGGLFTADQFH